MYSSIRDNHAHGAVGDFLRKHLKDRKELKQWFDELWNDKTGLVEDVKAQVLNYLEQLYRENSPEFIYFKTLYHIFGDYLAEQNQAGLLNEKTGFFDAEIWNTLYAF
jgi:hypothetical protein